MKKMVYVVIGNGWSGVAGVYANKEAAKKAAKNCQLDARYEGSNEMFRVKEFEVKEEG